jgi:putative addiction module component (TIGR02574 family)
VRIDLLCLDPRPPAIVAGFIHDYADAMTTPAHPDLFELSIAERIQLVQDLWDSIAAETPTLPLSDAQRREIVRRSEAHQRDPSEADPIDEALERIERSLA